MSHVDYPSYSRTQEKLKRRTAVEGVLLSGLGNADWPLLYTTSWTKNDLDRAERYYLTLFEAPGAVPALLHGMVRFERVSPLNPCMALMCDTLSSGWSMLIGSQCEAGEMARDESVL